MKVYILRGIPGSGKSTFAKKLKEQDDEVIICSTDDYFIKNGHYQFDASQIDRAHVFCQISFEKAINSRAKIVIVDNTNIRREHFTHYVKYAQERGYEVEELSFMPKTEQEAIKITNRSIHGVPLRTGLRMFRSFEQ